MWKVDLRDTEELRPGYERLFQKKALLETGRPLPSAALHKIRESLSLEWTYNSNSIEGNTLSLRETQMILEEGVTIKGKSLKEHFEAHNHDKAIDYLYKLIDKHYQLRGIDIMNLHGLVLRSIEDDFAGRIRNGGVRINGANFVPPNALKVSDLLDELIDYVNLNPDQLNDIELATVFHHRFVWIHPFFDGNGRTVRLAMNLLLMRKGFPPAIILRTDRKKYYEALNQANNGKYYKLALLMTQAMERTLNIYIGAIPGSNYDYDEISRIVMEPDVPYGQEYVSLLARNGKIDAHKEGKKWYTTKEAVMEYAQQKKKQ